MMTIVSIGAQHSKVQEKVQDKVQEKNYNKIHNRQTHYTLNAGLQAEGAKQLLEENDKSKRQRCKI